MDFKQLHDDVLDIYNKHKHLPRKNSEKHNAIQSEICKLGERYGYKGYIEFPCVRYDGRNGFIDVVWYENGQPKVSIEVDSSVRPKSVDKLLKFEGERIWIYYGNKQQKCLDVVSKIDKNNTIKLIML